MQREYQGFIFTHHALERAERRRITQATIAQVIQHPDKTYPGEKQDSVKFIRELDGRVIHVIATLLPEKKWLIVSVWVRGEEDPTPLAWQIITLPFRAAYLGIRWVIKLLAQTRR